MREGCSIFFSGRVGRVISAARGLWFLCSREDVRDSEAV